MKKQYFTTEVASLLNPPLLSKFKQLQKDTLENIYASKKHPLGRSTLSKISDELANKRFGIPTEQGESASIVIYPSNVRVFRSIYTDKFRPPNSLHCVEVHPAGIKMKGYDHTDVSGREMKEILNQNADSELSTVHQKNIKNYADLDHPLHFVPSGWSGDVNQNGLLPFKQLETCSDKPKLLDALWKLLKKNSSYNLTECSSFLKAYVQNFPRTFTLGDLQKILKNLGAPVSLPALGKVLVEFDVLEDGDINKERFMKALQEGFNVKRSNILDDRKFLLSYPCDDAIDHFITSASIIGDHKSAVLSNPAGIRSLRNDIRKPKLKSVADFTEYGDIKSGSSIIQPSLFEKYGIYDDDLGALRSKDEIKSILYKSGISFNDETFNVVWDSDSKKGYASIGNIWNTLKHLCLTENKVFD